jgi:spermidine/putrescine transport system substrate-binding protein
MKKLILALILLSATLTGCATKDKATLKVFNWGVYIDETVIKDFETLYNVNVIYDNYDSNESMYTKLQSGEVYDILVPTDWMVERLISEKKLQKIDLNKIPNLANVDPGLLNRTFDQGNKYSVPYFWGNIGIIYNQNNVAQADLTGWRLLDNPKYKDQIYIYDSERDVFMIAEKTLGYSVNTTDPVEINAAFELLKEINATTKPVYAVEDLIDAMVNEQKDIAVSFSGDAAYILSQNKNMKFFVPEEGTNIWMDSMVIPANAQNVALAHKWINYMLDAKVALKNTEFVGYTSPVVSAYQAVVAPGGMYEGINAYVPRLDNPKDESYTYNAELKQKLSDLWIRVKAQ